MMRPADGAARHLPWRGRAIFVGLLLIGLLVLAAVVRRPCSLRAPTAPSPARPRPSGRHRRTRRRLRPAGRPIRRPAPGSTRSCRRSRRRTLPLPPRPARRPPAISRRARVRHRAPVRQRVPARRRPPDQPDPEPGVVLITAVYNSIQDRFFRPLDSRDLLDAAWEGASRTLADQRHLPSDIDAAALTGDRAGDLQAFLTQYRALLAAAGSGVDANRVAMATSDVMTQSVGEQHTVFLAPDAFARFRASLTSDEGRVGLGVLIQGQAAPFTISAVVAGAPAEKAGVQEGDRSRPSTAATSSRSTCATLSDELRGEEGQPVTLTLRRAAGASSGRTAPAPAAPWSRSRSCAPASAEPPLSMRVLPEGVCYFRLSTFPVSFVVGPTGRTIGEDWITTSSSASRPAARAGSWTCAATAAAPA